MTRLYSFMGLEKVGHDIAHVDFDAIHVVGNRMRTGFDRIESKSREWEGLLDEEIVKYVTKEASKLPWYNKIQRVCELKGIVIDNSFP